MLRRTYRLKRVSSEKTRACGNLLILYEQFVSSLVCARIPGDQMYLPATSVEMFISIVFIICESMYPRIIGHFES